MTALLVLGLIVSGLLVAWLATRVASTNRMVEGSPIDVAPETAALFDDNDW